MKLKFTVFLLITLSLLILAACVAGVETCEVVYTRDMKALVDTNSISGSFILATGQVSGKYMYRFTEVLEDGGAFTRDVPSDKVVIYEHSDSNEAWVVYKEGSSDACVFDKSLGYNGSGLKRTWYELHIPEGTSVSLIDLDLE